MQIDTNISTCDSKKGFYIIMFIFHKTVDFCVLSISSLAECSNFFEEVVESVEVIAVRRVLAITRAVYKFAHKWHNGNDESYIYGVFNGRVHFAQAFFFIFFLD